jgi:polyphosphate kinase 2 (PPK2 family)
MPRKEILDQIRKYVHPFRITKGKGFRLKDFDPGETCGLKLDKGEAAELLQRGITWLAEEQDMLYAQNRWSLLLVFQALDAAGKDGTIKHVMSGVNPQGCQVFSFKQPSSEELDHDFMWRCVRNLPERGRIGIFNRSYYEEVLVVRVHPEILERQKYESYADLVPDEWTHLRIKVSGATAQFYVGAAAQPALIVHDLKRGPDTHGTVGLFVGNGTNGHFRNLSIRSQ